MKVGQLDKFDMPICIMARELGYDTIILQHEIGNLDAVTEILDVRQNASQYESTWEINDILASTKSSTEFPKVFFPETSYVTKVDDDKNYHALLRI